MNEMEKLQNKMNVLNQNSKYLDFLLTGENESEIIHLERNPTFAKRKFVILFLELNNFLNKLHLKQNKN